jgi:soluble lytic murein transglycosylase
MKHIAAILLSLTATVTTVTAAANDAEQRLVQLSVVAHSTGNLLLEQLILRRLMIHASMDVADAARHRLAENALARGDYAETIRLLNCGDGTSDEKSPQVRRDRALIGEAYRRSGDIATATQILNDVLSSDPNPVQPDDASLLAVKSLDAIGGDIDENSHFRRAGVYQFNRYWPDARAHYERVKATPDAAEALFQIGRAFSQDRQFADAVPYFQRVIDTFPETQQARDALLQLASALARLGKNDEAIARYQSYIDKYPDGDKLDRAYLNIVDVYRDAGDDAKALEWCQRIETAFAGRTPEALAIFDKAKIYASRGEWQNEFAALEDLNGRDDLGGASQPGGTTSSEIAGMRRLAIRQRAQSGTSALPAAPPERTHDPLQFTEIVVRRSSASQLDPRLVVAIMRQESNFDPQVRSNAAARGMMQFTHPQAIKIARELGWTYFTDDELYSPENSIALAVRYLADLNTMFPDQAEAVVASYNGGEDNVKRWMTRSKSEDPERYVPEFVFGQTKDYVRRVMANYRVYQQLYDEELRPR